MVNDDRESGNDVRVVIVVATLVGVLFLGCLLNALLCRDIAILETSVCRLLLQKMHIIFGVIRRLTRTTRVQVINLEGLIK